MLWPSRKGRYLYLLVEFSTWTLPLLDGSTTLHYVLATPTVAFGVNLDEFSTAASLLWAAVGLSEILNEFAFVAVARDEHRWRLPHLTRETPVIDTTIQKSQWFC